MLNLPKNKVLILSGPRRSGKTTALQMWMQETPDTCGWLTPDAGDVRVAERWPDRQIFPFQVFESEGAVAIGRFLFLEDTFEKMRSGLLAMAEAPCRYKVLDEVGPLELQGKGFASALQVCLHAKANPPESQWILVVREELVEAVVAYFKIKDWARISVSDLTSR